MTPESFEGVDIALFSCGASVSKEMREAVAAAGAVMIDNSSAFRMDEDVPLVVPEVNPGDVAWHNGVIANPNCSTIQMVVALKPLYDLSPIKRVVVSTYQAASGGGAPAMAELYDQTREFLGGTPDDELTVEVFQHRIAFNCIPHIDKFLEDDSTKEEWKMVVETKKIMGDQDIRVAATCVRVPVLRCHAEAVYVEFQDEVGVEAARAALEAFPGIVVMDDCATNTYPMPGLLAGTNETYVGRLRRDDTVDHGLAMWVVADQIRKGAALNARSPKPPPAPWARRLPLWSGLPVLCWHRLPPGELQQPFPLECCGARSPVPSFAHPLPLRPDPQRRRRRLPSPLAGCAGQ